MRVTVDVDVYDVLEELSDEDVIEEVRRRTKDSSRFRDLFAKAFQVKTKDELDRDYATRALEDLLAGRVSAGIALLDRALFPTLVKQ